MITSVSRKETNAEYHADKTRVSNSQLTLLKRSPKLFKAVLDEGYVIPRTAAMKFGDYVHCAVLEPDAFAQRYSIKPECDGRTKEGKLVLERWRETLSADTEIVTNEEYCRAWEAAKALRLHPEVSPYAQLEALSTNQVEQRFNFTFNGLDARCRVDEFVLHDEIIWDVKTCVDPSPEGFLKHVLKFGYHRQNAWYSEGVYQNTGVRARFLFAVVAPKFPHETAVYELDRVLVQQGLDELYALTDQLQRRRERGDWSAEWETGIPILKMPRYYDPNIYLSNDSEEEDEEADE